MTDFNSLTSILAAALALLVMRGLSPFMSLPNHIELRHFAHGLMWIFASFLLRIFYWGAVRSTALQFAPEAWVLWTAFIYGPTVINGLFNLGLAVGCWHILRALYVMIPGDQRRHWSVLTAAFYPRGTCFTRLVLRMTTRSRRDRTRRD